MSFAVVRGSPTAAQRYLDTVLADIAEEDRAQGRAPAPLPSLSRILFHCMNKFRDDTLLINGTSGESFTAGQLLRSAVRLARALRAAAPPGRHLVVVCRNHELLVQLFYACYFAGVVPLYLDPMSSAYEISHFMKLVTPALVFCDDDRLETAREGAKDSGVLGPEQIITVGQYGQFTSGHKDSIEDFQVTEVDPSSPAEFIPTSGSTGIAKAAIITHAGLIAHLPTVWRYHTKFPGPTQRAMFLSTAQWMTFSDILTSCPVYRVTALTAPQTSIEHTIRYIETFKPSWVLLGPAKANEMRPVLTPALLAPVRTLLLTGAMASREMVEELQSKVSEGAVVCNSYGMTEMQGFAAFPERPAPPESLGTVINILEHKLVSEDGKEITEPNVDGELYMRSDYCVIKGYLNNEEAYLEGAAPGGWWRTGDLLQHQPDGQLLFRGRKKFWFKYKNYQVSPEELEGLVCSVEGVAGCAVVGAQPDSAAAAGVVLRPGADPGRVEDEIHRLVNAKMMEYKRLHGGVWFVTSLPLTPSGKLHRRNCEQLINDVIKQAR